MSTELAQELKEMDLRHIAKSIVEAQADGTIDGWRDHLRWRQLQAGISNDEMRAAIEQEKKK